ncbi:MAG: SIMPL domain-containing protein [Candidatus Latescibacteria bacterium]|nr:SIMPL domain-containing protein [Candidatus Latescibacterota bacterium]
MRSKEITILSVGLLLSALILGIFFYSSRRAQNTIRVTGYATKRFESDILKWSLSIVRPSGLNDIKSGYQAIKQDVEFLTSELKKIGINENEITVQPVSNQPQYNRDGVISGYSVRQNLFIISNNLDALEKLARNPDFIYYKGIILESSYIEYNYSKIADLKKELLAQATVDAKNRAEEIAKSADSKLGKMTQARQGVFQITEPNSTDVSDYGIYSTATKIKDITVTVSATFAVR